MDIDSLLTEEERQELENLSPLPPDEQAIVDLLAGLMLDQYFMKIEKGTSEDE